MQQLLHLVQKKIQLKCFGSNFCTFTLGYTILHVIEFLLELTLWIQTPDFVPIYTEDGLFVKNPAIGFPHEMFSPICSEVSTNILGEACVWAHGHLNANITVLDNE